MTIVEVISVYMNIRVGSRSVQLLQLESYIKLTVASAIVVFCAWFIGYMFNTYYPLSKIWVDILESIGYVLWGTALAELKVDVIGKTMASEILQRRLQIFCSEMGIFVFFLSRTLATIHTHPVIQ